MRIGIDGRSLLGRRTGVGRYVFEICRELDDLLPAAEFFIYAPEPVDLPVVSERWHCRVEPSRWARSLKPIAWLKLRAGRLCKEDRLDVFWASATLLPSLSREVRTVTSVYDLTFRIAPETMGTTHLLGQRLFFARDVCSADHRLAISNGTAARLQAWLGGPTALVAPPAISDVFRPRDHKEIERTLSELKIAQPYLLAVGTLEPRKNLDLLIQVFRRLHAGKEFRNYRLVLVGSGGWKNKRLRDLLDQRSTEAESAVLSLGFVPDEKLAQLYAGCSAFVFPSQYEGFGMPILEARACGARVVASDLPEHREAGGEHVVYVEPTAEGLRRGLQRVITMDSAPPFDRTLLPTWRTSAEKLARLLI